MGWFIPATGRAHQWSLRASKSESRTYPPGAFPKCARILAFPGEASQRSISRVRRQILLYDNPPFRGEGELTVAPWESWPGLAVDLWRRFRHLFKIAERAAGLPVRLGGLALPSLWGPLAPGPCGVAFAENEKPAGLCPTVVEALYRIGKSSMIFGESDMVTIKDLTDETRCT
jgi:hypothetical protein